MQATMKFTYLGMDAFVGKKDPSKTYYNVSLLQNSEIAKVFLDQGQEVLFQDMQKFDEVICTVMFKLGQDRYGAKIDYRLLDIQPLAPELPEGFENAPAGENTDDKANTGKLHNVKEKATA